MTTPIIGDLELLRRLSDVRLLIVDDYHNMVKTIENMLIDICGFKRKTEQVKRAYDGTEAIRILLNQPEHLKRHIDLVLLDWNMPVTPGIEVLRAIRKSEQDFVSNVPVIMITAETMSKDINNAIHEGADCYLLKPFILSDLRSRMNPLLRHYWSGLNMKRAKNRRSETRYDAENIRLKFKVGSFKDEEIPVDVLNISVNGARVRMKRPEKLEIDSLHFHKVGEKNGTVSKISVIPFLPEYEGKPATIEVSMFFKFGFESKEIENRWIEWIELARKKDVEYRGQLR